MDLDKEYTKTISIDKEKVEKIAKQLFGISDLNQLVKTNYDAWMDLFKKGYYNDMGKPTLKTHFSQLTQ